MRVACSVFLMLVSVLAVAACSGGGNSGSSNSASAAATTAAATSGAAIDGSALYSANCASCHKADGSGGAPFPALAHDARVTAKDPTALIGEVEKGKGIMPGYRAKLSNAEIAGLLTYIRSAWGNKAPAVTEAQVAAVH